MIDTEKKVNELLHSATRRMKEYAEEAERKVNQDNPLSAISGVLHSLAWGLANTSSQIDSAISYVGDERNMLRHLLRDIMESLPQNRDWLNPDTEKWAREILKMDAKEGDG